MYPPTWEKDKASAVDRLEEDRRIGYLDPDIYDVLIEFMKVDSLFTKSSCSGRITIIDAEFPWNRKDSYVLFKNHFPIIKNDIQEVVKQKAKATLWLVTQGPILHVYAANEQVAWNLLKIARNVGFKHSGILSVNYHGAVVELRTGIKITIPILDNDIRDKYIEIANNALILGKNKLQKLKEVVSLVSTRD
ncbi:hypothetical protein HS7_06900 [Sulfolobales archaeon HS-7]|nr:hypothetical protein HS7_06900 [Sulfolobales archaeon HS-7]